MSFQTRIAHTFSFILLLLAAWVPAVAVSEDTFLSFPPPPLLDPYNRPPDKFRIRRHLDPFTDPRIAPYVDPLARYCDQKDTLYSLPDVEVINPDRPYWIPNPDLNGQSGVICYEYKINCVDIRGQFWTENKLICYEIEVSP